MDEVISEPKVKKYKEPKEEGDDVFAYYKEVTATGLDDKGKEYTRVISHRPLDFTKEEMLEDIDADIAALQVKRAEIEAL